MNLYSTPDICLSVAHAAREARLRMNLSRESLSMRSGVPEPSIKRFELTGEISLKSLVSIAMVLSAELEFLNLFAGEKTPSIDEIVNAKSRKRGRK
jgi:transcriptional regulator with XRE-family HTH domain